MEPTKSLDRIYSFNKSIDELRRESIKLFQSDSQRSTDLDAVVWIKFDKIKTKYKQLTHERNQEIKELYSQTTVRREPIAILIVPDKLKVAAMIIGTTSTSVSMTPKWFKSDTDETALVEKIKYPTNATEKRPFNTVACFRAARKGKDESTDFISKPIEVKQTSTETLVLALDAFVQQFGGKLSFTSDNLSFEDSAHRAACGVADLGSAHLLSSEHISSAQFVLIINKDYDEIARSEETMETFVLSFVDAVAHDLQCNNDYVRISSVQKSTKGKGKAEVNLVLTTPDKSKTEELAEIFKVI